MVESRGRGAGDGPRAPDRAVAGRHELQAGLPGDGRGKGARAPGGEARASRRGLRGERRGHGEYLARGPEVAAEGGLTQSRSGPRQAPVLDPVRLVRVLPAPAVYVLDVTRVVPREPLGRAFPLKCED